MLRYRDLIDSPRKTLDGVCAFLGVEPGVITGIGSANVSTWVPDTAVNALVRRTIRAGAYLGQYPPPHVWRTAERPLRGALHRHHANRGHRVRPEPHPEVRRELIARFADDIALLGDLCGRSFADWPTAPGRGTYVARRPAPTP